MELSKVLQKAYAQKNVCESEFHQALLVLFKLLAPMAPHISSELWEGECGAHVHQLETVMLLCNSPSDYSTGLSPKQEHFVFFLFFFLVQKK